MAIDEAKYSLLRHSTDPHNQEYFDDVGSVRRPIENGSFRACGVVAISTLLLISVLANVAQYIHSGRNSDSATPYGESTSHYSLLADTSPAKLSFDVDEHMWWKPQYGELNDTETFHFWDTQLPWESGIIALDNAEAAAWGLPESQSWPWDMEHKSIYIINAYHILHCVVSYSR